MSSDRSGNLCGVGQRIARFVREIDPFPFDDQRPVVHLGMDVSDIFPDDAHEEKLKRSEKEHADRDGRNAKRELVPVQKFVGEIGGAAEQREQGTSEAGEGDQA